MKILFICNQNENRSKTAEHMFKDMFETASAGLYNEIPVNEQQIVWADIVVVMEEAQQEELARRFPKQYMKKRIVCFDIPDIYRYNQPELMKLLELKVQELLQPLFEL